MSSFFLLGLGHPLQAPAHVLLLLGLGLLLGQQGRLHLRLGGLLFVLAVVTGLGLNGLLAGMAGYSLVLLGLALLAGVLLAVRPALPVGVMVVLAVAGGVAIGLDSAPTLIPGIKAVKVYTALAGTAVSASLAVVLTGMLALGLRSLLDGLVLRVLGSWVAASALMVLALMLASR